MSVYFASKLPASHAVARGTKAALLNTLRAHSLLSPTHNVVGLAPAVKEQCAALLWVDGAPFSVEGLKQLQPDARITLCTMFGLPAVPVAVQAQSDGLRPSLSACHGQAGRRSGSGGGSAASGGGSAASGRRRRRLAAAAAAAAGGGRRRPRSATLWWRRRRAGARRRRRSRAGARRRRRRADAWRNRSGARGRGGRRRAGARRRRCSGRPSPAGAASYRSTFAVASGHPRGPGGSGPT